MVIVLVLLLGTLVFLAAYGMATLAGANDTVSLWVAVGVVAALAIFLAFDVRSTIAAVKAREAEEREHRRRSKPIASDDPDETWNRYWEQ